MRTWNKNRQFFFIYSRGQSKQEIHIAFSPTSPFSYQLTFFSFSPLLSPFSSFPPHLSFLSPSPSFCPSLLPASSPALLRERLDVFYVQPDPACSPDDPLWFSSTPLERRILESLLTRVLLVRDIYTDRQHLEDDGDEEDRGEAAAGE